MARKKSCTKTKDLFVYAHDNRAAIMYLVTNRVNGKRYVGVTRKTLEWRIAQHFKHAKKEKCRHQKFARAIVKYGLDSFDAMVIQSFATFKEALAAEREYIAMHSPEYNITLGGEGTLGYRHSKEKWDEIKRKLKGRAGPLKGKRHPLHVIEKMRAARLANPNRYWLGRTRSEETKEKIRKKKAGVPNHSSSELMQLTRAANFRKAAAERKKPVRCLDDGQDFDSATEAALHYGLKKMSVISVCGGRAKSIYGRRFVYITTLNSIEGSSSNADV